MLDSLPNSAYHDQEVFMDRENVIANTRAGGVVELALLKTNPRNPQVPEILSSILTADSSIARDKDRILFRKLIRNANNEFPVIGKPSSAFVFVEQGRVYLHYLRENRDFQRDVQLHDYLRAADATNGNRYQRAQGLMSGHLAIITPEYQESSSYALVMLLDKVDNPNSRLSREDRHMINALHANGVLPITSSDYPMIVPIQ